MENFNLTNNERILNSAKGIESDNIATIMSNDNDLNTIITREAINKFNQEVETYNEKFEDYTNTLQKAGEALAANINGIECKPLFTKIHVLPYATNPFQKLTQEGGLIVDLGGAAPEYKSNETGEYEEEEAYIIVGNVVEVGPEVKWVKPGDAVMYIRPNQIDVPLYNTGLKCIDERSIIAVINEGLTQRFNNIK